MPEHGNIAGVVLAGGRSSRMGRNKALMEYNGRPLIDHMTYILKRAGVNNILISGEVDDYQGIPDETPFDGPAKAMENIMRRYPAYDGFLFVPVDMPLLEPEALQTLLDCPNGAYFSGYPLPAFITAFLSETGVSSVKELLEVLGVPSVALPQQFQPMMSNTNTPEEWQEVLRA